MVDILKITSPISIKSKVQNIPTKLPTDAIFDITNRSIVVKNPPKLKNSTEEEGSKQTLLQNLNKEIFEPLMNSTKAQSESVRKLVMMAKLFETSSGIISENFLEKFFIHPQEMLGELLTREKGETIFQGEFFDSLRMLMKLEGQPKLKEAIVSILKYFDCFVNQENSLKAVVKLGQDLAPKLTKADAQLLEQHMVTLDTMIKLNKDNQKEIKSFLKNELIPLLGKAVKRYQSTGKVQSQVMSIVHNIVRYDKAGPKLLEEAVYQLGEDLKPLTNLSDGDIVEMKNLVFEHADQAKELAGKQNISKHTLEKFGIDLEQFGIDLGEEQSISKQELEKIGIKLEETDMASLLSKALDQSGPNKINSVAQNLLLYMVQNESPVIPMMHFIIPFRYQDENTYGEFFIDKDCKERKGDSKEATNIFFTIQSDKYGDFEVDLLAKDKRIELDIRCPDVYIGSVKNYKQKLKEMMEEQGYRLLNYKVEAYQESQTIVQRFPKLALRKVGIDVKI